MTPTRSPSRDGLHRPNGSRREFLADGLSAAAGVAAGVLSARTGAPGSAATESYPKGFLWGVATAAHQVEGNNLNSDAWVLERKREELYEAWLDAAGKSDFVGVQTYTRARVGLVRGRSREPCP